MKQPLKIYLDTSDYTHLHNGEVEAHQAVHEYLVAKIASGEVVVVLSYPVMMELFQDYDPQCWDKRLEKAKFVKKMCGNNAFRFWMDVQEGENAYSDSLDWHAQFEKGQASIDHIASHYTHFLVNGGLFPKGVARKLKTTKGLKKFVKNNPSFFDLKQMEHKFSNRFYEKDVLRQYILGNMSEQEADEIFMECLNDPVLFCENYYRVAGLGNYFSNAFHGLSKIIHELVNKIYELRQKLDGVDGIMKHFDSANYWKNMNTYFPSFFRDILNAYIKDHYNNQQKLQRSDMADMMHAMYLPHADIWRGDSKFSNILLRQKVQYRDRIVQKLVQLPDRIDRELQRRNVIEMGEKKKR
jgi:hypothetical protein